MPKKNGKKTKKEKREEKAQKKADKASKKANDLLKDMEAWEKEAKDLIERQNGTIDYSGETLLKYEKRLKNLKALSDENKLSSEMIEGDPELKWSEKYNEMSKLIDDTYKNHQKHEPLIKRFDETSKDKNLGADEKSKLLCKKNELDDLAGKLREQNPFIVQYSCHLRFNSLIESLYKDNARSKELTEPVRQMIDQTKKRMDELKNRLSRLSIEKVGISAGTPIRTPSEISSRLQEEIDQQVQLNRQCIQRLSEESSDLYRVRYAPRNHIQVIQNGRGDDYPPLKKLKEKETEFDKQSDDFANNIIALADAKNELIALNKELLAQKAALLKEKGKYEAPPLKKATQSSAIRHSDQLKMTNLSALRQDVKKLQVKEKTTLQLSSCFDTKKGMPELLLHPDKKQYVFPTRKELNVKLGTREKRQPRGEIQTFIESKRRIETEKYTPFPEKVEAKKRVDCKSYH